MSVRRPILRSCVPLVLLSALLCGGCDLGIELGPPPPEPDAGQGSSVPLDGCVEGPTEPSEEGAVIRFSTLDVDRRLVVIEVGEQVTWVNASSQTHTATAGSPGNELPPERGGFDSGPLAPGGSQWAYRFCTVQSFVWFCRTHPAQMQGYRIVVE